MSGPPEATAESDCRTLTLPDNRTLAFAEYGSEDGAPALCFHGVPGSRRIWTLFDDAARRLGVRVIAPDRPGFGRSDYRPGRELLDWPGDVRALADGLGVDRFGVVGFSSGGPHAAACAAALPDRVHSAVLVSSPVPPRFRADETARERALSALNRRVPGFTRAAFAATSWLARNWRSQFRGAVAGQSPPDRELFDEPIGDRLIDGAAEAFRRGGRGAAREFPLLGEPWGFDGRDVEVPATLWHGRADRSIEFDAVRAFADSLPRATLRPVDEGHYSTLIRNREPILRSAVEAPPSAGE